jgi:hypothetical protein
MSFVRLRPTAVAALALVAFASTLPAQTPEGPRNVTPLDFSGVIYGNYRYTYDDATKAANGNQALSKFDIERVYLNFRMPAGDDGSIRITTDVFNNGTSCTGCYAGWTVRLKYAYFQYNFLHDIGGYKGFHAVARIGMLHTMQIDHEEGFFPRWISQVAIERNGFMASSDVGIAGLLTFPNKWGEFYATMVNGSSYSQTEVDPYKDYAARLSLTPFGNETNIWKTLTISPFFSAGHTASKFLAGGTGQVGPVTDGNTRNRDGVFVGLKDRRLILGAEWAQRTETVELGANTAASPRTTYDNSGTVTSGFILVRPIELFDDPKNHSSFGLIARVDNFKPFSDQRSAGPTTGTQTTSSANQLIIAGAFWDINSRMTLSVDWQDLKPQSGSTTPESKILFAHWQVAF